jgi:hypothetical protein
MAEYVKGLGEILAGQREEIVAPGEVIDDIMGKASGQVAAMGRMNRKQMKMLKSSNEVMEENQAEVEESEEESENRSTRRSKKGNQDDENYPNPDQMLNMLFQQNMQGLNGGGMGGGMGGPMGVPPGGQFYPPEQPNGYY